jgi:hypothetical protein
MVDGCTLTSTGGTQTVDGYTLMRDDDTLLIGGDN